MVAQLQALDLETSLRLIFMEIFYLHFKDILILKANKNGQKLKIKRINERGEAMSNLKGIWILVEIFTNNINKIKKQIND